MAGTAAVAAVAGTAAVAAVAGTAVVGAATAEEVTDGTAAVALNEFVTFTVKLDEVPPLYLLHQNNVRDYHNLNNHSPVR